MQCPSCLGEKTVTVLACPGARIVDITCETCKGIGVIDDNFPEWRKRGRELKMRRMEPYTDLVKMSELLRIDVVALSRMERGLQDPTIAEQAMDSLGQ